MISPTQNLSKTTGRYIENMNKKVVFFILPPKLITTILNFNYYFIIFLRRPILDLKFPLMIGVDCSPNEIKEYSNLFKEFCDIFAWSYEEMPGIDPRIVEHEIKTYPNAKPVR